MFPALISLVQDSGNKIAHIYLYIQKIQLAEITFPFFSAESERVIFSDVEISDSFTLFFRICLVWLFGVTMNLSTLLDIHI